MDHLEHCDLLEGEVERFAALMETAGPSMSVPVLPGWAVHDLALHLGTVHRWAEQLVRVRATTRIPSSEMGLDEGPVDGEWVRRGGEALLRTLRATDPAASMWAWGADQHVRFWSRRQLHETLVHRFDLELAEGRSPSAPAHLAADTIDEFLANLASGRVLLPERCTPARQRREHPLSRHGHGARLDGRAASGPVRGPHRRALSNGDVVRFNDHALAGPLPACLVGRSRPRRRRLTRPRRLLDRELGP